MNMRRREFIALIGGAAASLPQVARAQQAESVRKLAFLMSASESDKGYQSLLATFRDELGRLGWVENRNIRLDHRWGAVDAQSRQRSAKELITIQPDLLLAQSTPTAATLVQQTSTIPIIFFSVGDPVGEGLVASLSRPGRNATGFINMEGSMSGKWLELLKEVAPRVRSVAILFNPVTAPGGGSYYLKPFNAAAQSLGLQATAAPVHTVSEIAPVIAAQALRPNNGLIVMSDAFPLAHRIEIVTLAAHHRLPAIYPYREFVDAGGLLSYGNELRDSYRRAASYANRILRGEKPSELPVEVPVKFELVINLKTAKALELTVPSTLIDRADEVIE
jgi:putative ABC transport system substrate-binding protein